MAPQGITDLLEDDQTKKRNSHWTENFFQNQARLGQQMLRSNFNRNVKKKLFEEEEEGKG